MGKIKKLSEDVIAKIAAGQVVERPASVVKELLENSIDAEAKRVKIEIEEAGFEKIRVVDNGVGMDKEDVQLCLDRYVTSKINTFADLLNIKSMGFRGEALSSIAEVSEITIKSKMSRQVGGTLVKSSFGKEEKVRPVGVPVGTEVIVENLFSKVPARKKYLKTKRTEFRHVIDVVTNAALAFPEIGFQLVHNGKEIFNVSPNQSLLSRLKILLDKEISSKYISFSYKKVNMQVRGYVTRPQYSSKSVKKQKTFVNKRNVRNKIINKAVYEAFSGLLSPGMFPSFVIFVDFPSNLVDINVHPRKEKIHLYNEVNVYKAVNVAVKKALRKENLTYVTQKIPDFSEIIYSEFSNDFGSELSTGLLKDSGSKILQVHNTFLITQTDRGILIIDQHAAHERIIYEQLIKTFERKNTLEESKRLEESEIFSLSPTETEMLSDNIEIFRSLGFRLEEFGKNTFKLTFAPEILHELNLVELITNLLEDIVARKIPVKVKQIVSHMACRNALKAGTYLNEAQKRMLISKLAETKTDYICPHGRPAKVEILLKDVDRLFKRR